MSKYYHVSLTPGTSCPHCNKICSSIIGHWSHLRIHMTYIRKTQFSFRWTADDDYKKLYVLSKVFLPSAPRYCITVHIRVTVVFSVCRSPCQSQYALIVIYHDIINSFGAKNPTGGHPTSTTKHKQSPDHSFYRSFSCISNVM